MLSPDDGSAAGNAGLTVKATAGVGVNEIAAGADGQTKTLDDVLKDRGMQAEFDRRVTKALETQRQKLDAEAAAKQSEAEKLAAMNAEQKAQHEREKREAEITKREQALALKELRATAAETLAQNFSRTRGGDS